MDLRPYVENIHSQLLAAAESGGDRTRDVAERLIAPLDAALRLTLQDALAAAAEEVTCELAPGSVELRLRGGELEFVVLPGPAAPSGADLVPDDRFAGVTGGISPSPDGVTGGISPSPDSDEGAMSRINLRLSDHLKSRIEQAAGRQGLSVNAWLVRTATAGLNRSDTDRPSERQAARGSQRYSGWAH